MNILVWVVLGAFILIGIIVVAFVARIRQKTTDYRSFFLMGILWLPTGLILLLLKETTSVGTLFFMMGLLYMIIGLANRSRWGKQDEVSPATKKMMMTLTVVIAALFVLCLIVFTLYR